MAVRTASRPTRWGIANLQPGLRWRKAWRDLWAYKTRSVLVILSIAVGIFAFGLIIGTRDTLTTDLPIRYLAVEPASASLHLSGFDQELADSVARMPGVAVAEGRFKANLRYLGDDGAWHDLQLLALADYEDNHVNIVQPYQGDWPPADHDILIERNSLFLTGAALGDSLLVETSTGEQRRLRLSGLVHDMNQLPAQVTGIPYGYVTLDTLPWLGLPRHFNELNILVAGEKLNKAHILEVAAGVTDKVEQAGATVFWTEVPDPGKHLVEEFMPTIVLILGFLGLLALVLSAFLVVNVIAAILAQQRKQIGIMKSIGARPGQIISLYIRLVLILGLAALALALPASALGARLFSRFIAGQLNFDLEQFRMPASVLATQIVMGLLVPVLAALYPIVHSARITVREAVQEYGLGSGAYGQARLDRALVRIQEHLPLSRPLRISIRNTFRRKGRLARTLITLMLGGAIFLSVLAVRLSLFRTLEDTLASQGFDVQIQLATPYHTARIERALSAQPGLAVIESWRARQGVLIRADGRDGDDVLVYALPANTRLFEPQIVQGRWLEDSDAAAVVVPTSLLRDNPDLALGRPLRMKIGAQEESWRVVGVNEAFQPPIVPPAVYVTASAYARLMGEHGRADLLRLRIDPEQGLSDTQISRAAQASLQRSGIEVLSSRTASEDRAVFGERFNIITVILMVMAFLMGIVGALGLMGTMTINVLERTREIGVMRAIGASDKSIMRIFIVEGVLIGVLSWAGAILISQVMARFISWRVGLAFLELPLHFTYNWLAPVYWLIIVVVIAILASLLPAYNAAQLSVRETLAYE